MNRRHFLRRGATVAAASVTALGGCTERRLKDAESQPPPVEDRVREEEIDLPVRQKFETIEEAILLAADAEVDDVDAFETYLEDGGLAIEKLEEGVEKGEPFLSLEFVVEEHVERGQLADLGVVAGGYAALVEAGHDSEKLDIGLLDSDLRKFGESEIGRTWAEEYNEGTITAAKYGQLVARETESSR